MQPYDHLRVGERDGASAGALDAANTETLLRQVETMAVRVEPATLYGHTLVQRADFDAISRATLDQGVAALRADPRADGDVLAILLAAQEVIAVGKPLADAPQFCIVDNGSVYKLAGAIGDAGRWRPAFDRVYHPDEPASPTEPSAP